MKENLFRILKATAISMFAFLIFFNISVIVDENGFVVKMVNSILAEEWCVDCPENGGSGGSGGANSLGHWENYGTITQQRSIPEIKMIITYSGMPPVPTIGYEVTYRVVVEYYLKENCDPGGSQCTVGTSRKTYQGGS